MKEISVRGKWVQVPSLDYRGKTLIVGGTWLRAARVHDEAWLASELPDPVGCLEEIRKQRLKTDLFTFSQLPPGRETEYPYHVERDSIAVIPLNNREQWWMGLPQETRKNVRRSAKYGVRIERRGLDDALVDQIVQLNNSSALRQGRRYTHFGKSPEEVRRDHESFLDRSEFICAYHESELVGYIKLVYRGKIASILNILTNEEHKERRPANALMTSVVDICFEKGLTHLTYGFFHHGNKRDESITLFKTRHGFEEALVPRYYVPITLWGRLAIAMGLHRGAIGVLPDSVLKVALRARASWYSCKEWVLSRCSLIAKRPNSTRQMERAIPPAGSNS